MSDTNSHSQEYEVSGPDVAAVEPDEIPVIPAVASPGLLLRQILDRLTAVEEEVAELREENRQKDQRIAELEARLEDHESFDGRERATDRQRITALETRAPALREKTAAVTEEHQNHVKALLLQADHHRLKIKDIAPRLGLTRQQTWNIINEMERNRMVNVINDPHHRQRKLVELHQQIGTPSNY
jgi:TolA-binding protein